MVVIVVVSGGNLVHNPLYLDIYYTKMSYSLISRQCVNLSQCNVLESRKSRNSVLQKAVEEGAQNLQDRKMKDKEISGGGKCRTGKGRTKVQGTSFSSSAFSCPANSVAPLKIVKCD